jgi:hypothetical protein
LKRRDSIFLVKTFALICLVAGSVAGGDNGYKGFSPAYPSSPGTPRTEIRMPFLQAEKAVNLEVSLSESGQISEIRFKDDVDSLFEKYLSSILNQLTFEPALIDNNNTTSKLPLKMIINPRFRRTEIVFPVNSAREVEDRIFYSEALELNGFELPRIKMFPKYTCDIGIKDSFDLLPFTLEKLTLDSAGQVVDFRNVTTTLPSYTSQIQSASLWSEIMPLRIKGKPAPADCFLLVSFLPQLHYPTKKFLGALDDSTHWTERWRVQLLADTVGLMLPPFPKEFGGNRLALRSSSERFLRGEISATIHIDSLGNARVGFTDSKKADYHKAILSSLREIKFYPAMDYQGRPQKFVGRALFEFKHAPTVRVKYFWLNP